MWVLCIALCIVVVLWSSWQMTKQRLFSAAIDMAGVEEGEGVTKHRQIEELEALGVRFRDEVKKHQFLLDCTVEESEYYYSHPYDGLLAAAGYAGLLERVWSPLDYECVYEDDTYGAVLEALRQISQLPIQSIRGHDTYVVEFILQGKEYIWRAKENNDWLDIGLAGYLNRLLNRSGMPVEERFYLDATHVAPLYLFGTRELAERLNRLPRLHFHLAKG